MTASDSHTRTHAPTTGEGKCMSVFQSEMKKKWRKREKARERDLNSDLRCKAQKYSVWVCGVPCLSTIGCRLMLTGEIKRENETSFYMGTTARTLHYDCCGCCCCCVNAVEDTLSCPGHLGSEPRRCRMLLFPGTQSLLITLPSVEQYSVCACVLRFQKWIWLKCQIVASCSIWIAHRERRTLSGDHISCKQFKEHKLCGDPTIMTTCQVVLLL